MPVRTITPRVPLDPRRVVPGLGIGRGDPSIRVDGDATIAIRTADGPATVRFEGTGHRIEVEAWGPGAQAALDMAPGIVGADDDPRAFRPDHPLLDRLARTHSARVTRSGLVTEATIRTVFGQKVSGIEAKRSYRRMTRALGEPAPGPDAGLIVPADPVRIARLSYEDFHPWGVERQRAEIVLEVARRTRRLEEATSMSLDDAHARLRAVRGIGPWTAAIVAMQALGDADAVPVGDFHIPNTVAWALAGEPRGDDDRMLELLEPFRPHRGRVVRLLKAEGIKAPKYGPRAPLRGIEGL